MKLNEQMKKDLLEKFWIWLAWMLPRDLAKWTFVRVAVSASGTEEFAMVEMPAITCVEALDSWVKEN